MTRNWPSILSTFLRALGPLEVGDDDDMAVTVVLIALQRATTGEIDLAELARTAIEFDESRRAEARGTRGEGGS